MHQFWLQGATYNKLNKRYPIVPGGYACVGAAALAAAVSRTIFPAILCFEMTGQLTHLIPVLIAVLIANGVGSLVAPGFFDSIIAFKKLPYLPAILPSNSAVYKVYVEDFMNADVKYLYIGMTYDELKNLLKDNRDIMTFPLVDSPDRRLLLGTIHRYKLIDLLESQLGKKRRLYVAAYRRMKRHYPTLDNDLNDSDSEGQSVYDSVASEFSDTDRSEKGDESKRSTLPMDLAAFTEIDPRFVFTTDRSHPLTRIRRAFEAIFRKKPPFYRGPEYEKKKIFRRDRVKPRIIPIGESMPGRQPMTLEIGEDMTPEERRQWEHQELSQRVDFSLCRAEPAPFQLVTETSLLKTHSFFAMVGINYAYVTSRSQLVGVVGLKELRKVIADVNANKPPPQRRKSVAPVVGREVGGENKRKKRREDSRSKSGGGGDNGSSGPPSPSTSRESDVQEIRLKDAAREAKEKPAYV